MPDTGIVRAAMTAAYVGSALLVLITATRAGRRERLFWWAIFAILAALAAGKQLHAQEIVTNAGRAIVRAAGVYAWHRAMMAVFVVAISAVALSLLTLLFRSVRAGSTSIKMAAAGMVLLIALLVVRAASLHGFELWFAAKTGGMPRSWWCELLGLAISDAAALSYRPRGERTRRS
jgi:hypothetical protein